MNPALAIVILRAILCEPDIKAWLEKMAKDSSTPIDDVALTVVYLMLVCK